MTKQQMAHYGALAIAFAILGSVDLGAQQSADTLRQRCARITAAVEAGRRDTLSAYASLHDCGVSGATALARSWGVWKRVTDRAALEQFANTTRFLRDPAVFDALLDVAADESATPTARALALRNLRVMRKPGSEVSLGALDALARAFAQPGGIRDVDTSSLCGYGVWHSDVTAIDVRPISAGQQQRLAELRKRLMDSPTEPPLVRAAAMCG